MKQNLHVVPARHSLEVSVTFAAAETKEHQASGNNVIVGSCPVAFESSPVPNDSWTTCNIEGGMKTKFALMILIGLLINGALDATAKTLPFISDDYSKALHEAKQRHLPLFVEVWAPW